jgi:hypothetical protein
MLRVKVFNTTPWGRVLKFIWICKQAKSKTVTTTTRNRTSIWGNSFTLGHWSFSEISRRLLLIWAWDAVDLHPYLAYRVLDSWTYIFGKNDIWIHSSIFFARNERNRAGKFRPPKYREYPEFSWAKLNCAGFARSLEKNITEYIPIKKFPLYMNP